MDDARSLETTRTPVPALFGHYSAQRILAEAEFTLAHVRRAIRVADEGLTAVKPRKRKRKTLASGTVETTIEDGGTPDWDARLTASAQIFDLAGVRKRPADEESQSTRPVAIQVVINQRDGDAATDRVSVQLGRPPSIGDTQRSEDINVDA